MSSSENIKCLTFDLDDTLWELGPTIVRAENALHEWLDTHYSRITERHSVETLREQRSAMMTSHPKLAHDVTALRHASLRQLADEFDYPHALADEGLAVFRHHRNQVELFEDTLPLLKRLRPRYTLGAITNGNADLDAIGIGDCFDFAICAGDVGCAKPDSGIFNAALDRAEAVAEETVHIGDDPNTDVRGAARLGMRTVWINPRQQPWPGGQIPDAVVRSIAELETVLESW